MGEMNKSIYDFEKEQLLEANRRNKCNTVKKETRVRKGSQVCGNSQVLEMGLGE